MIKGNGVFAVIGKPVITKRAVLNMLVIMPLPVIINTVGYGQIIVGSGATPQSATTKKVAVTINVGLMDFGPERCLVATGNIADQENVTILLVVNKAGL